MQIQDLEIQLLYGLFKSICEWAAEKGINDVSALKNLLKTAMVEVYLEKHQEKSPHRASMAAAIDLGVSLRNIEVCQKQFDKLNDVNAGFIRLQQLLRSIAVLLGYRPQTLDDLLKEVSYLIHAPQDLQKRAVLSVLKTLEQSGMVRREVKDGIQYYVPAEDHLAMFHYTDKVARLSALVSHFEVYENLISEPFLKIYHLDSSQAEAVQSYINESLNEIAAAQEHICQGDAREARIFYYIFGSGLWVHADEPKNMAEAILSICRMRFADPSSPSMARTHWSLLTPDCARTVYREIHDLIVKQGEEYEVKPKPPGAAPFVFYFGMTGPRTGK